MICITYSYLDLYRPNGYAIGDSFARSVFKNGGSCIFVKNGLKVEVISLESFCKEKDFEICGLLLCDFNLIVLSLYRAPTGDPYVLEKSLDQCLSKLKNIRGKEIVICTDLNIDFNKKDRVGGVISNILKSYNLYTSSLQLTRKNSCLDYIISSYPPEAYVSAVDDPCISDHAAVFMAVHLTKFHAKNHSIGRESYCRHFSEEGFLYFNANFDYNLCEIFSASDSNICFGKFF